MRGLTPDQIKALTAKFSRVKVLFDIQRAGIYHCTGLVGGRVGTNTYRPRSMNIGSIIFGDPSKLRMVVNIDDTDGDISGKIFNYESTGEEITGENARVYLIAFDPNDDNVIGTIALIDGSLVRCEISTNVVKFDISASVTVNRSDALITGSRSCGNRFKKSLCKYAGTDDVCNHTWMDCVAKGNQVNFNGFRFAPVGGTQIMVEAQPPEVGYSGGGDSWVNQDGDDQYQIGDCMWWEELFWGCDTWFDISETDFVDNYILNPSQWGIS